MPLEFPGAVSTYPWGINNAGQIDGTYVDSQGVTHGFIATIVPEPVHTARLIFIAGFGTSTVRALRKVLQELQGFLFSSDRTILPASSKGPALFYTAYFFREGTQMFDSLDEQIKKDEHTSNKDRIVRYALYGLAAAVLCIALICGARFMS